MQIHTRQYRGVGDASLSPGRPVLAGRTGVSVLGSVYAPYRVAAVVLAVVWVAGLAAVTTVLLWLRFAGRLADQDITARFGVLYEAYRPAASGGG